MPAKKKNKPAPAQSNGAAVFPQDRPIGFVPLPLLMDPGLRKRPRPEDGPPCHMCNARCCKYFAFQIDTPEDAEDYDHIRWYLMHEGVAVWRDDGDWYIEIRTPCRHLQPDNSCGIYEYRPQICRDYGLPEQGPCEYFTEHLRYELYFENDDQFVEWVAKKKRKRKKKKKNR